MAIKKVSVVGAGYVGLTLAAVLAKKKYEVNAVDINPELIQQLKACKPHFYEQGLSQTMRMTVNKNLFFTTEIPYDQDAIVLSAGTPIDVKKKPVLEQIINSTNQIKSKIKDGTLIVLRSTVPIGTTRNLVKPILDQASKKYYLAYCPERTIEGKALEELEALPQIIGGINEESVSCAEELFRKVTNTIVKVSNLESAESAKLLCNTYRDIMFSIANEFTLLLEKIGKKHGIELDPEEIINASNSGYIRAMIPKAGGVGGLCLDKDPYILHDSSINAGYNAKLITLGRDINNSVIDYTVNQIIETVKPEDKIFISGLAFKGRPPTDDIRASPTIDIIKALQQKGYNKMFVHDFVVSEEKLKNEGYLTLPLEEGFKDSKGVLIANNHVNYGYMDIDKYVPLLKERAVIFDMWRNIDPEKLYGNGKKIIYKSIGYTRSIL